MQMEKRTAEIERNLMLERRISCITFEFRQWNLAASCVVGLLEALEFLAPPRCFGRAKMGIKADPPGKAGVKPRLFLI